MARAHEDSQRWRAGSEPLTARARLLERLIGSVTDYAILALDVDGTVITWNPGAEKLKGYQAEEIIGRHFSVFYSEAEIAAGKPDQELAIAVADGHYEEEGWRIRKDGTEFWASVVITPLRGDDGGLLGFGKITRDLTERKRGEEALRESEERFRLLVSGVADYAIFLVDTQGRIASWNVGAERLKGYRADEVLGRELSTFYTEEDRRAGVPVAALEEARAVGRWASEGWRVRKDGTRFWAGVVITKLIGRDGIHRGFAKVTRDLTERKRNEDALRGILEREREAADQLRAVDRMRRDLVSTVAHDLQSPIGVVQSFLHLLRADWDSTSDAEKLEAIERISQRTSTLASLVNDVLELARIDAGHLEIESERFDLTAVAERTVLDLRATHPDSDLVLHPSDVVWAHGDARRTWQILTNLVSNALKFTAEGSKVEVTIARQHDEVAISVTDHGPGIRPEDADLIFERFSRLAGPTGSSGSGLGLFIARSLAEAQHGRIEVDSEPGAGATFRLVLPAVR